MNRERKVTAAMLAGLGAVLVITLGGALTALLGGRGGSDFLRGMSTGMLAVLPWAIVAMVWLGYRQMDEFGRRNMQGASTIAFVVVMLACGTYYPLQTAANLPALPLWGLWVLGWGSWGAAFVTMSVRAGRKA